MKTRKRKSKYYERIEFSEHQEGALVGTLLGDTYLGIGKFGHEAFGNYAHSEKQKEYIYHKFELFQPISGSIKEKKPTPDKRTGKIYKGYMATLLGNPYLTVWHNRFYGDGKKKVPLDIKVYLTKISLAYWFMDDGSKSANGGYYFSTDGFRNKDRQLLRDALEGKFGLKCSIDKQGRIYIWRKSIESFNLLVEPYIVSCMRYKLIYSPRKIG